MKIFSIAVLSVLVLAAGGAFVLTSIQETAAQAETTGSARFNQDENVNFYGREAPEYLRQVRDAKLHDRTCGVTAIRKSRPVGRLFIGAALAQRASKMSRSSKGIGIPKSQSKIMPMSASLLIIDKRRAR